MIRIDYSKIIERFNETMNDRGDVFPCYHLWNMPLEKLINGEDISETAKQLLLDLELIIEEPDETKKNSINHFNFVSDEEI